MTRLTAAMTPSDEKVKKFYQDQKIEVETVLVKNPTKDQIEMSDVFKWIMKEQKKEVE